MVNIKDQDLDRTIKTFHRVRTTLRTVDPRLASPLYRIHRALIHARKLRKEYQEKRQGHRTETATE